MHTGFLLETYKVIKIGYPHFVMFAPLIILVSVVLAVEGIDWAGESDGVKVGVEGTLGRISPYEELARKKNHIAGGRHSVRRKRKKEKKKQRTNCKNNLSGLLIKFLVLTQLSFTFAFSSSRQLTATAAVTKLVSRGMCDFFVPSVTALY